MSKRQDMNAVLLTPFTKAQLRTIEETKRDRWRRGLWPPRIVIKTFTRTQLYHLYVEQGLSAQAIANMYDTSAQAIYHYLHKWKIPIRNLVQGLDDLNRP